MTIKEKQINGLVERFLAKPYLIGMGAGSLSKMFNCEREDIYKIRRIIKEKQSEADDKEERELELPKILILDIETAPMRAFMWSRWKQNIYLDQTISDWFILTWSAKWLYSNNIMADRLTSSEAIAENDKRVSENLWKLLDKADMVVAHNGDYFDIPRINAAFLQNGIMPPSPYKQIDTRKIAAKQFGFSSNKLEALARMFNIESKLSTNMTLWVKCMNGDTKALEEMMIYNEHDVEILEDVYLILRPWVRSHPNVGLYMDTEEPICPHCGSKNVKADNNAYYTNTGKYETYRCDCGAVSRKRKTSLSVTKNKNMLVPIPR